MEELKTDPAAKAENPASPVVRALNTSSLPKLKLTRTTLIVLAVFLVLGVVSGYSLFAYKTSGTVRLAGRDVEVVKTATEEGVKDASTFRDTATGVLAENDGQLTDEGTHILTRGDASQNVYLTSSVIDLAKYKDKKVQVWGETFQGQKAGWLMDVGRIKVLE
jgi:hypothetical protein